jgi:hypothetical protein
MEQNYYILQNKLFTGTSNSLIESNLKYIDNYYLNQTNQEEKIVDFSNIRAFLTNESNQKVVKAYYSFLTSSTLMNAALIDNKAANTFIPTAQFKAVFYDDEKLADSFNSFYNTSILRGVNSNYSANPDIFNNSIRNQLLDGDGHKFIKQNVFDNYYFWKKPNSTTPANSPIKFPFTNAVLDVYNGDRNTNAEEKLVDIPTEGENYFINVFLLKRFTQTARIAFEACNNIVNKSLSSNTVYSQNLTDILRHKDYLNNLKGTSEKSFDNSFIKTPGVESISQQESFSSLSNTTQLIQCFIDPNFMINENEYWSDIVYDNTKIWIGNENTKTCEISNALFRGRNVGTYNTGNYIFSEIYEVYKINEQPTGKIEENTPNSPNFIIPFSSNGPCPMPEE